MKYQIILKGEDLGHDVEKFVEGVEREGMVYIGDEEHPGIIVDEIQLVENP